MTDPVHIITKYVRKDPSCQVLSPSRGFREAQGRIRGDIGDRHITHNCVSLGVRSCAAKDIDLELFEITYVSDFRLTVLCM